MNLKKIISQGESETLEFKKPFLLLLIQKEHIQLHAEIRGTERIERWEYPIEATREAVTNAICHQEHSTSYF